jgi:outer membrane protein OmpA-like peptidoglycan-associated protein
MTGRTARTVADSAWAAPHRTAAARVRRDIAASVGQPLDGALRERMESRVSKQALPAGAGWGFHNLEAAADAAGDARSAQKGAMDFSAVRLHCDDFATSAARRLRASAFTAGGHIYLDRSAVPVREGPDAVVAHELGHVAQQRQLGRARIQPRLIATGDTADIERFIVLAEPAMGEDLEFDPATGEVKAVGSLATPATSPTLAATLHQIMDDPTQNAEAVFGTAQPLVEGFTDDVGTPDRNDNLSIDRSNRIEWTLTAAGVGANRIHAVGRSAAKPVAPNTSEANRARNRRVVITVDRPGP